jgi:predicted MFS family arabinose efflux permease
MFRLTIQRYRAAYSGLPREVWLLAVVLFVNRCGSMVLPFLPLYLTSELHMSEASAGRLIAFYGVGAICGAWFGGRLVRSVGAIRLQTLCLFLSVPAFLLIPLWKDWLAIGASLFGLSLISEAVRPANGVAVTQRTTAANRTRALALNRLAVNLGLTFGPALGGALATIHFGLLFVVDALTTLAAAVAMLYFFGFRKPEQLPPSDSHESNGMTPLRDGVFVSFLALMLVNSIVFFQLLSTYPMYLRDHFDFTEPMIGIMFSINTVVIVAFEMLLIDAIRNWSLVRTIGWGCFLSCAGFGMLPFGSSVWYAVVAMLVLTVGEMLSLPLSTGFVANRTTHHNAGLYLGWYTVMFSIGSVLGPVIGSSIYGVSRDAVWLASLGVGVVVLAGFHILDRSMRRIQPRSLGSASQASSAPHIAG